MKHLENSTPNSYVWNTSSYVVKSEDGADDKGVRTSQGEKKLKNCQLCNRHYDLNNARLSMIWWLQREQIFDKTGAVLWLL